MPCEHYTNNQKIRIIMILCLCIESSKEHHLFKIEIFCDIINVFTVTFDRFNPSLMNKSFFNLLNVKKMFSPLIIIRNVS